MFFFLEKIGFPHETYETAGSLARKIVALTVFSEENFLRVWPLDAIANPAFANTVATANQSLVSWFAVVHVFFVTGLVAFALAVFPIKTIGTGANAANEIATFFTLGRMDHVILRK